MLPFKALRMSFKSTVATAQINPGTRSPTAFYDVSDITTLFQDTAGTVAVTATGQAVARINDKSGNGFHLLQATAAQRPLYQLDAGGHPCLVFDGVNDNLSVTMALAMPYDHISAIEQITWVANGILFYGGATNVGQLYQNSSTPQLRLIDGGTTGTIKNSGAAVGSPAVVTARHIANASKLSVNNGGYVGPADVGASNPSSFKVGCSSGTTNPSNINWYGSAIKNGGFADADVPGITAWFGAKIGLVL